MKQYLILSTKRVYPSLVITCFDNSFNFSFSGGIEVSMILVLDLYRAPGYAEAERRLTKAATENAVKELLSRPARTVSVASLKFK